jgi:uncharacterized repeat protein (TIGR03803 family)
MRMDRATSFRGALLASVIALTAFAACAQAQTYNLRVIHRFTGAPNDGESPEVGVVFDGAGNLYGTTVYGGTYDGGTIFKIAKDGTETILHSFEHAEEPVLPGEVTIDPASGDVYGTTYQGGGGCAYNGCGEIYKLAADGTFTELHAFGDTDGGPNAPLVLDPQGNLYGSTSDTVFEYGADGTFTTLHTFTGPDGARLSSGVIRDRAGNLYGVTNKGGANDDGTIYKLAPDGTLTTLYSFTGGADGSNPYWSLAGDRAGNLYGTTWPAPHGTVFKLAPDGTFTTLYTFTGGADGDYPNVLLPISGNLYGTTNSGGENGNGTVFKLAPDGTFTVLHAFTLREGRSEAGLALKYGKLFGTTLSSFPRRAPGGTVYSLSAVKH